MSANGNKTRNEMLPVKQQIKKEIAKKKQQFKEIKIQCLRDVNQTNPNWNQIAEKIASFTDHDKISDLSHKLKKAWKVISEQKFPKEITVNKHTGSSSSDNNFILGFRYYYGIGVKINHEKAAQYFNRANSNPMAKLYSLMISDETTSGKELVKIIEKTTAGEPANNSQKQNIGLNIVLPKNIELMPKNT